MDANYTVSVAGAGVVLRMVVSSALGDLNSGPVERGRSRCGVARDRPALPHGDSYPDRRYGQLELAA
jgi:hypothetical protein